VFTPDRRNIVLNSVKAHTQNVYEKESEDRIKNSEYPMTEVRGLK
jgi:hypothetical protein